MSDTHLANAPEARTETGEIKNLATPLETPKPEIAETKLDTEVKPEVKAEAKPDDKSILNKKDPAKPEGAPEKYEDFTVPEGFTLDPKVAEEAGTLFKELNLSQAAGQKLIDMYTAKTLEAAQAPYKAYTEMREGWQKAVKADPEIGSRLAEVKTTVAQALDSLGDPKLATEFREAMDLTGAGDHPAFIKAFYKLAQKIAPGNNVRGTGPSALGQKAPGAAPRSAASAIYPNLP